MGPVPISIQERLQNFTDYVKPILGKYFCSKVGSGVTFYMYGGAGAPPSPESAPSSRQSAPP